MTATGTIVKYKKKKKNAMQSLALPTKFHIFRIKEEMRLRIYRMLMSTKSESERIGFYYEIRKREEEIKVRKKETKANK